MSSCVDSLAPSLRGLAAQRADWGSVLMSYDTPSDPALPGHLPQRWRQGRSRAGATIVS